MNKQILIADDDCDLLELLSFRCKQLGLEVDTANNAMTALGKAEEMFPDIILLDVDMPYGNGLCVCEMMAHHEELKTIPVIVMTGNSEQEVIRRCHDLCAYYVLKCPDLWPRIEPLLQDILDLPTHSITSSAASGSPSEHRKLEDFGGRLMEDVFAVLGAEKGSLVEPSLIDSPTDKQDAPWVLAIEDDTDAALALRLRLESMGVNVLHATAGMEGYRQAFTESPVAIILDYELPEGNGDYVLRRLKESPATCDIPVIMLTGRHEAYVERQMRGLGASEFLHKPLDWQQLRCCLTKYLPAYAAV